MSMSKDRVQFVLGGRGELRNNLGGLPIDLKAAQKAFNLSTQACFRIDHQLTTIICRPSQFARFMIYRNEMGGKNTFQNLEAKLIPAKEEPTVIDVSKEPAEGGWNVRVD